MTKEEQDELDKLNVQKVMDSLAILKQQTPERKDDTLEERQAEWDRLYDSPDSEPVKYAMPARPSLEGDQMNEDRIKQVSRNQNRFQGGMNKDEDYSSNMGRLLAKERPREEDYNKRFIPERTGSRLQDIVHEQSFKGNFTASKVLRMLQARYSVERIIETLIYETEETRIRFERLCNIFPNTITREQQEYLNTGKYETR